MSHCVVSKTESDVATVKARMESEVAAAKARMETEVAAEKAMNRDSRTVQAPCEPAIEEVVKAEALTEVRTNVEVLSLDVVVLGRLVDSQEE